MRWFCFGLAMFWFVLGMVQLVAGAESGHSFQWAVILITAAEVAAMQECKSEQRTGRLA